MVACVYSNERDSCRAACAHQRVVTGERVTSPAQQPISAGKTQENACRTPGAANGHRAFMTSRRRPPIKTLGDTAAPKFNSIQFKVEFNFLLRCPPAVNVQNRRRFEKSSIYSFRAILFYVSMWGNETGLEIHWYSHLIHTQTKTKEKEKDKEKEKGKGKGEENETEVEDSHQVDSINENYRWNNCNGRLYRKGWRSFAVALMNVFVQSWNRRRWHALTFDCGTRDVTWPL